MNNNSPDFFVAGVICGVIILVAIVLLVIVRRANSRKLEASSKVGEKTQLKAYNLAYESKDRDNLANKNKLVSEENTPDKEKKYVGQTLQSPRTAEKPKEIHSFPAETAVGNLGIKKEEATKPEMFNSNTKKEELAQPPSIRPASKPNEEPKNLVPETKPSLTPESNAGITQPSKTQSASPLPPPVTSETQLPISEKPAEEGKKDSNDAFNLFTDVAVQQSETSKFAAKLQDVDISQVSKEAQDLFNAFKHSDNSK